MRTKKTLTGMQLAVLLSLVYFSSYITRINFAAIIQEIITATRFSKSALSIIPVCLSVTYGTGQIINGIIGDRVKPQTMILCGLSCVSLMNVIFPLFSSSIPVMCVLWAINGFAQAMMWPPIVKILVCTMRGKQYADAMFLVSCGSSGGTVAVYLFAPMIITLLGWKAVFFVSAAVGIATLVVFALCAARIPLPEQNYGTPTEPKAEKLHFSFPRAALFPILFICLGIILQGMLRDGVSTWMPSYLVDIFKFSNTSSILTTVVLAIFSIVVVWLAGKLRSRFFKNEVNFAFLIFALSAISGVLLYAFFDLSVVLSITLMMLINGCMHGINLMLISYVPKRFSHYGNISTISGCINSCTYIGSAISTYGIAKLVEMFDWRFTLGSWAVIGALGAVACGIAMLPWKRFYLQKDKE